MHPEVEKLTPEVQQTLAKVELARFRRQVRLLRRARSYPGRRWLTFVCLGFSLWVTFANVEFPYGIPVLAILAFSFGLVHVHSHGVNQRLDALLELLPSELPVQEKDEAKSTEK